MDFVRSSSLTAPTGTRRRDVLETATRPVVYDNLADPRAQILEAVHFLKRRRQARDYIEQTASMASDGWMCPGCFQRDRSRVIPSADRSGDVCVDCGACLGQCLKEARYEAERRGELGASTAVTLVSELDARDAASSSARQRMREKKEGASTVPKVLEHAQSAVVRGAALDALSTAGMTVKQKKASDRSIVCVHSTFSAAGLNPDVNPLCQRAGRLCEILHARGCAHARTCPVSGRACVAVLIKGSDAPFVAAASMHHVILLAEEAAARGEAFDGLDLKKVLGMCASLKEQMSKFYSLTRDVEESKIAIRRLLGATTTQLATVCHELEEPPAPLEVKEEEAVGDDDQAFASRLRSAMRAVSALGLCRPSVVDAAEARLGGVSTHNWLSHKRDWPIDVVALIVIERTSPTKNVLSYLKKTARRHKIAWFTVEGALGALPSN